MTSTNELSPAAPGTGRRKLEGINVGGGKEKGKLDILEDWQKDSKSQKDMEKERFAPAPALILQTKTETFSETSHG